MPCTGDDGRVPDVQTMTACFIRNVLTSLAVRTSPAAQVLNPTGSSYRELCERQPTARRFVPSTPSVGESSTNMPVYGAPDEYENVVVQSLPGAMSCSMPSTRHCRSRSGPDHQ